MLEQQSSLPLASTLVPTNISSRSPQYRSYESNQIPPSPSSSSLRRQPQLVTEYTPPPNFPTANVGLQNNNPQYTTSSIHHSHEQFQDHQQPLLESDYELKGDDHPSTVGSPSFNHDRMPYPIPQGSLSSMSTPTPTIDRVEPLHQENYHNNVTFIQGTPLKPGYKPRSSRRMKFICIFCVVVIGIGIGVGVGLSHHNNNSGNNSNNNNNVQHDVVSPSSITGGTPTTPATLLAPKTSTSITPTTTPTTPAQPVIPPPPMPSLPPKGQCPQFICIDDDNACQNVCMPDGEYNKCAKPCNGDYLCQQNCKHQNPCFQACQDHHFECMSHCFQ